ncbi:MAG: chemotaxis protein CheA, partial [Betaproteobacteria bacterium]|nr:chemotaxis protein CheA [Betaproteobacteria bacterium]
RFDVISTAGDDELFDLFSFHVARELVQIAPASPTQSAAAFPSAATPSSAPSASSSPAPSEAAAPAASASAPQRSGDFGLFDGAPGAPGSAPATAAPATAPARPVAARPAAAAAAENSTLRVSVTKIDQLLNLVGELVINQAMLTQNAQGLDAVAHQRLLAGIINLERNTRDLQEAVMSIRMIPMSVVFSRFPRMLRDLANKLGKQVELVTVGDATELDKGLIEKITDPLTHLVRNSCDHGIELPADRVAAGKPAQGTITLSAFQQGGSVVIEVRDDGRGLPRDKILSKAIERGLPAHEGMSDAEVWQLIFAPGFSTAEQVTDVSGRGVGMDVVKKNIASLNGTVDIESTWGVGMKVSIRLPLTLAIMDGMSVRVGHEVYILPLGAVVESFQPLARQVSTVAQGPSVVRVRDEYMPVVSLRDVFGVPDTEGDDNGLMIVVESEGARVALRVDELLGQHQIVVKNLETNYRKVPCVSGATILGDGKVALIIEPGSLLRRVRH